MFSLLLVSSWTLSLFLAGILLAWAKLKNWPIPIWSSAIIGLGLIALIPQVGLALSALAIFLSLRFGLKLPTKRTFLLLAVSALGFAGMTLAELPLLAHYAQLPPGFSLRIKTPFLTEPITLYEAKIDPQAYLREPKRFEHLPQPALAALIQDALMQYHRKNPNDQDYFLWRLFFQDPNRPIASFLEWHSVLQEWLNQTPSALSHGLAALIYAGLLPLEFAPPPDYPKALSHLEQASQLAPENGVLFLLKACLQAQHGDNSGAKISLGQALSKEIFSLDPAEIQTGMLAPYCRSHLFIPALYPFMLSSLAAGNTLFTQGLARFEEILLPLIRVYLDDDSAASATSSAAASRPEAVVLCANRLFTAHNSPNRLIANPAGAALALKIHQLVISWRPAETFAAEELQAMIAEEREMQKQISAIRRIEQENSQTLSQELNFSKANQDSGEIRDAALGAPFFGKIRQAVCPEKG
jgi:hypothetical protein